MSYSDADRRHYVFTETAVDFATTSTIGEIRGPKGKSGRLIAAGLAVSTTIAGTTGDAKIQAGISGTLGKYMSWLIGEPVADTCRWTDDVLQTTNPMVDQEIAADAIVLINIVEDTTADGAGDGVITVIIDWAW